MRVANKRTNTTRTRHLSKGDRSHACLRLYGRVHRQMFCTWSVNGASIVSLSLCPTVSKESEERRVQDAIHAVHFPTKTRRRRKMDCRRPRETAGPARTSDVCADVCADVCLPSTNLLRTESCTRGVRTRGIARQAHTLQKHRANTHWPGRVDTFGTHSPTRRSPGLPQVAPLEDPSLSHMDQPKVVRMEA